MSKTLKFLGDYASEADYEALHLFLFGFFNVDVLEKRPRLIQEKKKLERDLQALTRLRGEGEIEQLILIYRERYKPLPALMNFEVKFLKLLHMPIALQKHVPRPLEQLGH